MLELKVLPTGCANRRRSNACDTCGARPLSVCASIDDADLSRLDALAEHLDLQSGETLIQADEAASHVFNITSGSVRVYRLLSDGRRQITGFLFAGDFLGLATGDTYVFSAEAIEPVTACRFRKSDYRTLIRETPALETALLDRANHELVAAQNQMLLLGRKTALERVSTFLLEMPTQDPARPGPQERVHLPMTRAEIADYLGLTIETVSRVFTRLKTQGVIRLISLSEVRIEQPDVLRALADGEA
ncbi:helix-turn-helix domain-containing protein [Brevundimonas variabilis]|uniref:CRP/FNR family transcriptional regulator n=1 Tax=Brevundimonas variabilis TaxID=74312 RepID=A0A7W9FEG4_9CAUL|nr:helix-turn-helix domain-containing protein [Brevundimonas variabilis]MBB5746275.1 CRP/FNR family transcriptional regulator [Brevundimonas variabilis]